GSPHVSVPSGAAAAGPARAVISSTTASVSRRDASSARSYPFSLTVIRRRGRPRWRWCQEVAGLRSTSALMSGPGGSNNAPIRYRDPANSRRTPVKAPTRRPARPPRAWVGVVSRAHVRRGVAGGFAQLSHGKRAPLARMNVGDWLVYYSPRTDFPDGAPLRAFTALGRIVGQDVYA